MFHKILKNIVYRDSSERGGLQDVLNHATKHVPYYQNFDPSSLENFPILTKDIIKSNFEKLKSDDLEKRKWRINTSGGSTGEPAKFIQDKSYLQAVRHTTYKQKEALGYNFGDKMIKIWGDEKEILTSKSVKHKIVNYIKNTEFINSFLMSEKDMQEALEKINSQKPKLLVSYVQSLYEIAKFANKQKIKTYQPEAIIVSAGTLYDFMKKEIISVFGENVYNRYGSREVGNIACEQPNVEGLVVSGDVFVEIVDKDGKLCKDGVEGEIIVTSLVNYAMPLIRYKIGDRGALIDTPEKQQILQKVSGRVVNVFYRQDGHIVDGEYFTHLLYHRPWLDKFQVVQKSYNKIVFFLVKTASVPDEDLAEIKNGVKKAMGQECEVEFQFVENISPSKSGKFLYTLSELYEEKNSLHTSSD